MPKSLKKIINEDYCNFNNNYNAQVDVLAKGLYPFCTIISINIHKNMQNTKINYVHNVLII